MRVDEVGVILYSPLERCLIWANIRWERVIPDSLIDQVSLLTGIPRVSVQSEFHFSIMLRAESVYITAFIDIFTPIYYTLPLSVICKTYACEADDWLPMEKSEDTKICSIELHVLVFDEDFGDEGESNLCVLYFLTTHVQCQVMQPRATIHIVHLFFTPLTRQTNTT